jgi:hypothetical protein
MRFMGETTAVRSWICERVGEDSILRYEATLLIGEEPIASARGVDERSAFTALLEMLLNRGSSDGFVLGMAGIMGLKR